MRGDAKTKDASYLSEHRLSLLSCYNFGGGKLKQQPKKSQKGCRKEQKLWRESWQLGACGCDLLIKWWLMYMWTLKQKKIFTGDVTSGIIVTISNMRPKGQPRVEQFK